MPDRRSSTATPSARKELLGKVAPPAAIDALHVNSEPEAVQAAPPSPDPSSRRRRADLLLRLRQLQWQARAARYEAEAIAIRRTLEAGAKSIEPPAAEPETPSQLSALSPAQTPPAPPTDRAEPSDPVAGSSEAEVRSNGQTQLQRVSPDRSSGITSTECSTGWASHVQAARARTVQNTPSGSHEKVAHDLGDRATVHCVVANRNRQADRKKPGKRASPTTASPSQTRPLAAEPRRGLVWRNLLRPKGWHASALAHGALVVILLWITLPAREPPRMLDLQAVTADDSSETPVELTPADVLAEASVTEVPSIDQPVEMHDWAVEESSLSAIAAPLSRGTLPAMTGLPVRGAGGPSLQTVGGGAAGAVEFFGIRGEGRNLCWIVDCSRSMSGQRFTAACDELVRALQSLRPDQRFSVAFYSQQLHPMCLDGQTPDPYPIAATPENIARCCAWIRLVELEAGGPPDDALAWALERRPEAIFLLSDGEFPSRVEDWLEQANRRDSLFEPSHLAAIIHTIGFSAREGQTRLARIAARHGGQFRQVTEFDVR